MRDGEYLLGLPSEATMLPTIATWAALQGEAGLHTCC